MRSYIMTCHMLLLVMGPLAILGQSNAQHGSKTQQGFDPDSTFSDLALDKAGDNSALSPGESAREKIAANIFVRGSVSKATCYPGEPVLLTYQLFSALQNTSHISVIPALSNCNAVEWPVNDEKITRQKIGNKEYAVLTIREVRLSPFRDGEIRIDPLTVDNEISSRHSGHYSGETRSNPVRLNVLPLPLTNQPPGFSGIIGDYRLRVTVQSARMAAGEMNNLHIEIAGSGSLDNIGVPVIRWPKGMETFIPKQRWQIVKDQFPPSGGTSIDIPFTANRPGPVRLDPILFSYFNPALASYRTLRSDPIALDILPSATASAVKPASPAVAAAPSSFRRGPFLWVTGLLILLAGAAAWFIFRSRRVADPAAIRTGQPAAIPSAPVIADPDPDAVFRTVLEKLSHTTDPAEFYPELKQGLTTFLQDKLATKTSSEEGLLELLRNPAGEGEDLLKQVSFIYSSCGEFLYSPTGTAASFSDLTGQAYAVMDKMPP
jgi:hypothetical protein